MLLNINLDKIADLDFKTKEAYKTLRTNVQFCGENVKVVSLTSCVPNEGKSMAVSYTHLDVYKRQTKNSLA